MAACLVPSNGCHVSNCVFLCVCVCAFVCVYVCVCARVYCSTTLQQANKYTFNTATMDGKTRQPVMQHKQTHNPQSSYGAMLIQ